MLTFGTIVVILRINYLSELQIGPSYQSQYSLFNVDKMNHTIGAKWHRVCIFIHYVILNLDSGSLELLADFSSLVGIPPRLMRILFSMIVSIVSGHVGPVKVKKCYMCKAASR